MATTTLEGTVQLKYTAEIEEANGEYVYRLSLPLDGMGKLGARASSAPSKKAAVQRSEVRIPVELVAAQPEEFIRQVLEQALVRDLAWLVEDLERRMKRGGPVRA